MSDWHGGPRWPHGVGGWIDLGLLVLLVVFYVAKTWLMWRRSGFIDRLGASIIVANGAMALAFGTSLAWTLYPPWYRLEWLRWPLRAVIAFGAGWALVEMWRAKPARVRRVTGHG